VLNTRRRMRHDGTADGPRLRSLAVAAAPTPETERLRRRLVRLACDVHDGPMQDLTAAGYGISDLRRRLEGTPSIAPTTLSNELDQILGELAHAERGLRTLLARLEQVDPAADGIQEIVETEVAGFAERCSATVDIELQPDIELDSHSQSHALRAVLHESLTNVARHAEAHRVQVCLHGGAEGILLEVRDDGHGFDAADIRADAFGLSGMKKRVELLGGELDVLSRRGGPTVVTARLERWSPHAA
jgi:signal transduction histidine kinase